MWRTWVWEWVLVKEELVKEEQKLILHQYHQWGNTPQLFYGPH
jgi:hypothetical protein